MNVYDAAKLRIKDNILSHDDFLVSFSGGKDSGVMVNLVIEVAKSIGRLPVKVVFSDLEAIFSETERYVKSIMDLPEVEPYWLCLEEIEDNASSVFQRYWRFWDSSSPVWCRDMPKMPYVINNTNIPEWLKPYYISDNVEEWTITQFGEALCDKNGTKDIVQFIGMRCDESYGRLMNIAASKNRKKENKFTYQYVNKLPRTWISIPLYDWKVSDIWYWYSITSSDYNRVYDSMQRIGLKPHEQRTCFAFGEEQKTDLWMWCMIEPETWDRMVQRVSGANFGKIYNHTNLNRMKIKKPDSITWKNYTLILLRSLPDDVATIFKDKFEIVFKYHKHFYELKEGISPDIYIQDSRKDVVNMMKLLGLERKYFISWETLASAIIKRDFVFKKYGFGHSKKMNDKILKLQKLAVDL